MVKDYLIENIIPNYFGDYMSEKKVEFTITNITYPDQNTARIEFTDDSKEGDIDGYVANYNNSPVVATLTREKLDYITASYKEMAADFAAHNSVIMNELGYSTEDKKAFVRKAVDAFLPIKHEMDMFSYYDIWDMFDAIERDEILTDERINEMKNNLYNVIFG